MQFVYVFNTEDCEEMKRLGYELIQSDAKKHIFVFRNKDMFEYESLPFNAVFSNTLTL